MSANAPELDTPDVADTEVDETFGPTAESQVRRVGRLSQHQIAAAAQQLAGGVSYNHVADQLGLNVATLRAASQREPLAGQIRFYQARLGAQAAMNLTRIQLAAATIIDNLITEASDRMSKNWLDASKVLLPHILPRATEVEVHHRIDAQTTVALQGSISALLRVQARLPDMSVEDDPHVVSGEDGVLVHDVPVPAGKIK